MRRIKIHSPVLVPVLLVFMSLLALAHPAPAAAVAKSWNCGSDSWENAACWNPVGVPAAADTVTISPGAAATVTVSTAQTVATALMNANATLVIANGGNLTLSFTGLGSSTLRTVTINSGGTLTVAGTATVWVIGPLTVDGAVDIVPLATLDIATSSGGSMVMNGTSTIAVNGKLNSESNLTNNGTLKGTGTVRPNTTLINNGIMRPGNSPGILTIDGDYTQTASGTLVIEINGTTAGTDYSQLRVQDIAGTGTGTATLAGRLTIVAGDNAYQAGDFAYQAGDFAYQAGDFTTETVEGGAGTVIDQSPTNAFIKLDPHSYLHLPLLIR